MSCVASRAKKEKEAENSERNEWSLQNYGSCVPQSSTLKYFKVVLPNILWRYILYREPLWVNKPWIWNLQVWGMELPLKYWALHVKIPASCIFRANPLSNSGSTEWIFRGWRRVVLDARFARPRRARKTLKNGEGARASGLGVAIQSSSGKCSEHFSEHFSGASGALIQSTSGNTPQNTSQKYFLGGFQILI